MNGIFKNWVITAFGCTIVFCPPPAAHGDSEIVQYTIFRVRINDIISYEGTDVARTWSGMWVTLGPFDNEREITLYEPGFCEEKPMSGRSSLRMWTDSEDLSLCIYDDSELKCDSAEIKGVCEDSGHRFFIDIGGRYFPASDTFSDFRNDKINFTEAENELKKQGSRDLVRFLLQNETREIENFTVEAEVDGKRFQILGMILYDPTFSVTMPSFVPRGGARMLLRSMP